uniref:Retrotransposon protein n=1 Tax=Tanacetum cinerariifolium TaxID=118510 RepID=A0A699GKL5_TANCI|nr:retrotransposon protein [Tanacetum cinerariifolium]
MTFNPNNSKIVKAKGERKSLALKAKKESSDEDEEYAMEFRDFKKFFKIRDAETQIILIIGECSKPPKDKTIEHLLEVLRAITSRKMMKRLKTKRVSWLKYQMSEIVKDGKVIDGGIRKKGLYVMKVGTKPEDKKFLATNDENSTLWHRRLGHIDMRLI